MKIELDLEKHLGPSVLKHVAREAIERAANNALHDIRFNDDHAFLLKFLSSRIHSKSLDELERKIFSELQSPVKYLVANNKFMGLIDEIVAENEMQIKTEIRKGFSLAIESYDFNARVKESLTKRKDIK